MYIDSTSISLFLSAALVMTTIVLALATGTLVRETKRMREFQETPRLGIRVEKDLEKGMSLVLRNEGQGVAQNVRFTKFEGDPTYYTETVVLPRDWEGATKAPIFEKGVAQWEPGQTFTLFLGGSNEDATARAAVEPWRFHVQYENQSGKRICQVIEVDFSLLLGSF